MRDIIVSLLSISCSLHLHSESNPEEKPLHRQLADGFEHFAGFIPQLVLFSPNLLLGFYTVLKEIAFQVSQHIGIDAILIGYRAQLLFLL